MRCRSLMALLTLGSAWASAEVSTPLGGAFTGWDSYTFGESIQGDVLTQPPSIPTNWIVKHGQGYARDMRVSATVEVTPTHSTQWKVAGVGCYHDADNFWHLALVETPTGDHHFIELSEMLGGAWNSQTNLPTVVQADQVDWQYGHPYLLTLIVTQSKVMGEVSDSGRVIFRDTRTFAPNKKAVTTGRAALETAFLPASFSQVTESQSDWAQGIATPGRSTPSYPGRIGASTFGLLQEAGRWWFKDPAGKPFLMVTTDHVNYNVHFCEALGYAPYHRNAEQKYGSESQWAEAQVRRLRSWNFNSLSVGASSSLRHRGLPYAAFIPFGTGFSDIAAICPKTNWTGWPDVFDPRWPGYCQFFARQHAQESKGDPWLIGAMIDNEMEWYGKGGKEWGLALDAWKLPPDRAARKELVRQLEKFYKGDLVAFNADFGLNLKSFADLPGTPTAPKSQRATDALMSFVAEAAERYFSVIVSALHKEDPGHLVLGCRFAYDAPDPAVIAAGKYCDVVSVNIYPRVNLATGAVLDLAKHLSRIEELTHRPLMVTEWGFPALDAKDSKGIHLPSTQGAGMRVDTQAQRALCFRAMQTALFSEPYVIGSSHFMYVDEPALGISSSFTENSNYGLVSESDEPYAEVVAEATKTNAQLMSVHRNGPQGPIALKPWLVANSGAVDVHVDGLHYSVSAPMLRLVKETDSGDVFDHILVPTAGVWRDLGHYGIVVSVQENGHTDWQGMSRVESVTRVNAQELRLVLSNEQVRCSVNLRFGSTSPYFLAQVNALTSLSATPWTLGAYYHYPRWREDEAAQAQAYGAGVPNYWIPAGAWVSPTAPFGLGAIAEQDGPVTTMFFKDASLHADCYRTLNVGMEPGRRWVAHPDEPWVAIFAVPILPSGKLDLRKVVALPER